MSTPAEMAEAVPKTFSTALIAVCDAVGDEEWGYNQAAQHVRQVIDKELEEKAATIKGRLTSIPAREDSTRALLEDLLATCIDLELLANWKKSLPVTQP